MENDILDVILNEKNKENKIKKRKGITKRIILVLLPLLAPAIVVYLLFLFTPQRAWLAYKGQVDFTNISGISLGNRINVTSDNFQIGEGKIYNAEPIKVKYKDKELTLDKNEFVLQIKEDKETEDLGINFINPNIKFNKLIDVYSKGENEFEEVIILRSKNSLFQKEVSESLFNIYFTKGAAFPLEHEIKNGNGFNLENFMRFNMDLEDETDIILSTNSFNPWEVYIKGELIKDLDLFNINRISKEGSNVLFIAEIKSKLATSFNENSSKDYSFYFDGFTNKTILSHLSGTINVIKTGEPQNYDIDNTRIVASNSTNSNVLTSNITYNQENNLLEANIYGEVNKLTLGGFSIFPNLSQWLLSNMSALVTTILTAIISGLFSMYVARGVNKK